ncbi:MAG: GNAT family N-acetyltransferase [bacterium]|nr:GNAT family N-acetyltransferase [bacterium]
MVTVREATAADNDALIALDRQCAMGEAMTLAFDRAPDFFARHKVYERWTTLVAEAPDGAPVGTGSMALKTLLVGGRPVEAAYLMDLRVHPDWRRRGVGRAIGDGLRDLLIKAAPAFAYLMVLKGNEPSLSFIRDRGVYTSLGKVTLPVLVPEDLPALPTGIEVRPLAVEDMSWLAERWEACTDGWSLALPLEAGGIERLIAERLEVPPDDRLVVLDEGAPIGAAALWDYSRIMSITFVRLPEEIDRRLSPSLRARLGGGEPFRFYYPLPLVWRSLEDLPAITAALLTYLADKHAGEQSATTLWMPMDSAGPMASLVAPKAAFSVEMDLFGVPIRGSLPTQGPFFIDPRDI